jgi:hypothetical protein
VSVDQATGEVPTSPPAPAPPARGHRGEALGILAVVVMCSVAALVTRRGCAGGEAGPESCAEIARRYAEARLRQADPKPAASAIAQQRAASEENAARSPRFARCPRDVSAAQAECALGAHNADEIERCLQ